LQSRYSHVVVLVGAILAFLPVIAVDYVLDAYVRSNEKIIVDQKVLGFSSQIEQSTVSAMTALRRVLADSPSLCTPTFIANVHQAIETSINVKQMLVENADGAQYCDAFGRGVTYSRLSEDLPIAGHAETLSVVKLGDLAVPTLKITQALGAIRQVSAFVPVVAHTPELLKSTLPTGAMVRIMLTDGTPVMTLGDQAAFERHDTSSEFLHAQTFAGSLPIKVDYAVPFAVVRADYAALDVGFTIIACMLSAAFLLLSLQYVRRSSLPGFDLERAISHGEIKPYYQPVINLRTGGLEGCEVLCRWEKKNGKIVSPGTFIDYAEVTGLAIPMTLSLMQQVRADLGELCQQMPNIKVSINLFEGHFRDGGIVEDVQAIFGNSPIQFHQLVFEITERHPLANSVTANSVIAGLQALGCRLALDDAGTGHSNLAYLGTLGVDVIKIDRVFVEMITPTTTQVPVLDGLIAMAKDLECEIVAEGVETEAQALYLRARGVVQAQGFIFAPPLRIGAFRELAEALHKIETPRSRLGRLAISAA
jgi:EAL domain-containing protein (putative c-di-GMP-specific phosphodiesterase class I)